MREQYMRKGEGFILCYSVTDRRSYDEVLTYKKLINQVRCRDDIPVILVANKCDLHEKRKVLYSNIICFVRTVIFEVVAHVIHSDYLPFKFSFRNK